MCMLSSAANPEWGWCTPNYSAPLFRFFISGINIRLTWTKSVASWDCAPRPSLLLYYLSEITFTLRTLILTLILRTFNKIINLLSYQTSLPKFRFQWNGQNFENEDLQKDAPSVTFYSIKSTCHTITTNFHS